MMGTKKTAITLCVLVLIAGLFLMLRNKAICFAAKHGQFSAVRILACMGANVDGTDGANLDHIPLHSAIYNSHWDVARYLISKGASVRRKNDREVSPLALAMHGAWDSTSQNLFSFLEELISLGVDVNARDYEGETALMNAPDSTVVKFLLAHGADPNIKDNKGEMILHKRFNSDIIPVLIRFGVDATLRDNYGNTPIHTSTFRSFLGKQGLENFELMIQAGLDPRARDSSGNLAVTKAIEDGMDDLVALLERHGAGEEMTPELEAARDRELAGMLFRRMHALRRASGCEVTLRNGEQMAGHGRSIFGVNGETVEAWGQCPSGGVLHGVVYGSGKVFHQFLNLDAGLGGFKPLSGFQGQVAFTVTPEMEQAEVAWVVTEKPAVSIRKVLEQASASLASKQRVMVGRRGN